jgi:diaminopimelate decarboxylase
VRTLRDAGLSDLMIMVEPGRSLVAPYGVLVARIVQTKQSAERRWVMINAGMNDLIRPALYSAKHRIELLEGSPQARMARRRPGVREQRRLRSHPLGAEPAGWSRSATPAPTAT